MSFPSLVSRSFPRRGAGKQALAAAIAFAAIVAGCGGSGTDYRPVEGNGYSFEAPVGWKLVRTPRALGMRDGDVDLVQVTRLPLVRPYTPALFDRVVTELDRVARELGKGQDATVAGKTVRVLGQRTRQYDLGFSGRVEQLTFVLRGKTNYQLLCRRNENGDDAPCRRLVSSFRPNYA
jgi:hypothetical protein